MSEHFTLGEPTVPLVMVGTFPPPVHGMSVVNEAVRSRLKDAGIDPVVIDLSSPALSRSLVVRAAKLPRVLRGGLKLLCVRRLREAAIYLSVSGGLGQLYELLFLVIARIRRMRPVLHHHSFAYLDRSSLLTRLLCWVAGNDATHVTLSLGMAQRLASSYRVSAVLAISNAFFVIAPGRQALRQRKLATLGFLSNVSPDKGIFEFIDLCEALVGSAAGLQGLIAGPFQSAEVEQQVQNRLSSLPHVKYVGARYGADKEAFFDAIDVLVFPTRYKNEAEPVTIHEAIARGVPVIAYGRGCIPEIVGEHYGLVIDPEAPFVPPALAKIESWIESRVQFEAASDAASRYSREAALRDERHWHELCRVLGLNANERTP